MFHALFLCAVNGHKRIIFPCSNGFEAFEWVTCYEREIFINSLNNCSLYAGFHGLHVLLFILWLGIGLMLKICADTLASVHWVLYTVMIEWENVLPKTTKIHPQNHSTDKKFCIELDCRLSFHPSQFLSLPPLQRPSVWIRHWSWMFFCDTALWSVYLRGSS